MIKKKNGFTLPELTVVMGMLLVLFAIAATSLLGTQHRASISSSAITLISDLKQQQIKAMVGDTEGRTSADYYSIHFSSTSYDFFHGTIYTSSDFTVNLEQNLQFQAYPSGGIIFTKGSGEIYNYAPGVGTITLVNTAGNEQKTITINRFGVVTSAN